MGKTIFYKSKNWPQKRGKTSFLRCADLIEIINNIVLVRDADLREGIRKNNESDIGTKKNSKVKIWPQKRGKTSFLRCAHRNHQQHSIGTGRGPQRSNQNMAPSYKEPLKAI